VNAGRVKRKDESAHCFVTRPEVGRIPAQGRRGRIRKDEGAKARPCSAPSPAANSTLYFATVLDEIWNTAEMSITSEINVKCKLCGAEQQFPTWSTVNVTQNPELKAKLLKGELTRFVCEKCGWSGELVHPLLYHDMAKKVMIWLWPDAGEPDTGSLPMEKLMNEYQFRVVASRNDLIEKILIIDHNMDDRIVELVKLRLWAQSAEQGKPYTGIILFSKTNRDAKGEETMQLRHLKESEAESLTVPFDFYHQTRESVSGRLPPAESERGKWLRVDKEYAKTLAPRSR
jgi:hypothetical protein